MKKKIALDIDNVCCDFTEGFLRAARLIDKVNTYPESSEGVYQWDIPHFNVTWPTLRLDPLFWQNLPPYDILPFDFEVAAYVTARPLEMIWVTIRWLDEHGFPNPYETYVVSDSKDKPDVLKSLGIDVFVDDKPSTVQEVQAAGIEAFLFHTPIAGTFNPENSILSLKELNAAIQKRFNGR